MTDIPAWFAEYDARAARADIEGLADLAVFPLNLVTDIPGGTAATRTWDRAEFIAVMTEVIGDGSAAAAMRSTRTPHALGDNLAVVVTDAEVDVEGHVHAMRYADILVRTPDGWAFQTMVQPGYGVGWERSERG